MLESPREFTSKDFVLDARNTWAYVLELVQYEWITPERLNAFWA